MKSSSSYTIKNLPLIFFIELTFPFACCTEKSNILECVAPSKEKKKSEQTEEMMQPRDVDKREDFRKISYVSEYCFTRISGEGFNGYVLAMDAIAEKIND